MQVKTAFINGLRIGIGQWRIAAIVYFLQLCLALTVGMQVYDVLQASIGHSLEINKLLEHYDHTVVTDFLKVHGASITPLIGQLRWLLLAWLLFSVFTDGGLLYCTTTPQQASGKAFWQGGAANFFSFLKISLFFLALALLWTLIIFLPIVLFFERSLQYFNSEKPAVWLVFLLLAVWLAGFMVLFVWSVLSRVQYLRTGASVWSSLKNGGRIFRKNKALVATLMAAFGLLQILMVLIYWTVEAYTGMVSPLLILVVFLVQQAFVFGRIQVRQMMYAALGGVAAGV